MEKSKDKSKQAPNQNREIARSVIAIAVFSVAITGGLALLICLDIFSLFDGSFVYSETFATTAYWLRLGITAIFSIALSVAFAYLILRKSQNNKTLDQSDIPDAEETDINTDNKAISDTASDSLQAALDSERLMNNLLINMLYSDISTDSEEISSILQNLLAFVKSDYCGYYIYDDKSNAFSRKAFCDFDIDLARHSSRLEELQTDNYAWTLNTLQTGKASIFRTAMLDELRQKSQQAKDDAQQWINQQIQSSAEYKLCKNEGWQYLVCLPQLAENTLTGLFLFGYQKDVLPIQQDEILRLESYADTLGKYLSKPHEKAALQQSGDSINEAIKHLQDAIFLTDTEGRITAINPAALALRADKQASYENQLWNDVFQLIDTESRLPVKDPVSSIYKNHSNSINLRIVKILTADGMEIEADGMAAPIRNSRNEITGVIFILRDITDRIFDENERLKAHKMEAISSLSAGLAHDFNNILTTILGSISLALDDAPPGSDQEMLLKTAEESTLRGKEITDKLLTFAKSSPRDDVSSDAAKNLESLVREQIKDTKINAVFHIEKNLPYINMPTAVFETIIVSLVTNSLQAMPNGGGIIVKAAVYEHISDKKIPLRKGLLLHITITDTGESISRENLSRIFVPYFTTHKGSKGLGLPTVNSLLVKHNGFINITSEPDKGTTCEVYIPVAESSLSQRTDTAQTTGYDLPTALILDEEDALGNLMIKIVSNMGLQVMKTSDPHELKSLYEKAIGQGRKVNLLLADLNIPSDIDVKPLVLNFKDTNPDIKVIAYSDQIQPNDLNVYQQQGFDDILAKPFNINDLEALIKRNSAQ